MTRIRILAAAAFAAIPLALSTFAIAQAPPYGPGPGPGPGAIRPGGPPDAGSVREHLQELHDRLALRSDQEAAWRSFAGAVERQAQDMQSMRGRLPSPEASAPERFQFMAQLMQQGARGMANVARALSSLYAILDPHQRAIVDQEFAQGPGGPPPQ
jgi:LTXXQ motif family protein